MMEKIIKYNGNPIYESLYAHIRASYIEFIIAGTTSNLDCTLDVNVKLGHGSFPEVWVDVYL